MPSEIQKIHSLPPAMLVHVEEMPVVRAGNNKQRQNDRYPGKLTRPQVEQAVDELNMMMEKIQTNLIFSIDDATKRIVIKVIDGDTQEVIRQIPPEETLRIASHISKLMGILVDESA